MRVSSSVSSILLLLLHHHNHSSDAFTFLRTPHHHLSTPHLSSTLPSTFLSSSSTDDSSEEPPTPSNNSSSTTTTSSSIPESKAFESAAVEWAKQQRREMTLPKRRKKYVVIGGGWGGWGAAKTLCQSDVNADVYLIEALPDPTGKSPYLSESGKPVEAGTRGFWKDYPNINALCDELDLDPNAIFTPFTNSSFYSPDGLEATAPVFSEATIPPLPFLPSSLTTQPFPTLPSPLGQVLATFPLFERLPLPDRASMIGLLLATIDCFASDEDTQAAYDRMTAHELFLRFGISSRLVEDFIKPTLLVGLFKPPEELSALVVMELLYYYALAHQDSFDVRWIKNGTVADSLILPLAEELISKNDLKVLGGCKVGEIGLEQQGDGMQNARNVTYTSKGSTETLQNVDGIVLALGCRGMKSVVSSSPSLALLPEFSKAASLQGIDVISTRIWLDRIVDTRTPANVFSRFAALRGAGGTFFMLDQLQENDEYLWGGEVPKGSVVAADFYNAGGLMCLSEEDIVNILMEELLPSAVPKFADAQIIDSWVGKYPGTVSWFSPGSYNLRPPLEGSPDLPNLKCAGDWVRMGEKEHGSKGLCQERAYVSGIHAANSLLRDTVLGEDDGGIFREGEVLEVREDEEQFKLGLKVNKEVMKFLPRFWVR